MRSIAFLRFVTSFTAYGQTASNNSGQKAALAMITRLGSTAEIDESLPGKPIVKLTCIPQS